MANQELTEHVEMLESQNYFLRQQNCKYSEQLSNKASDQCETCIDYIKEVRRLEITL